MMQIKKLNPLKRAILGPFRSLLKSDSHRKIPPNATRPQRILITRTNHRLGNQLLVTPLVEDLVAHFPDCTIDFCVQGQAASIIHQENKNVGDFISLPRKPFKELGKYTKTWLQIRKKKYDLVINPVSTSTSGRLATKFSKGKIKLLGDEYLLQYAQTPMSQHLGIQPVYNMRGWLEAVNWAKSIPLPQMKIHLTEQEILHGKKVLDELNHSKKERVIAIYTYATDQKCYCNAFWQPIYEHLKKEHNALFLFEILPVENISQINDPDLVSYYSKDIREIASVMHHCELIVVADSGIMHLAAATKTATIGLFKNNYMHRYTPYGIGNTSFMAANTESEKLIAFLDASIKNKTTLN